MVTWLSFCALLCLTALSHGGGAKYNRGSANLRGWVELYTKGKTPASGKSFNNLKVNNGLNFYPWSTAQIEKCPVNVIFVVDSSESVSKRDFLKAREYLKREIRSVNNRFNGTDIGVLFFSDGVTKEIPLQTRTRNQMDEVFREIDAYVQQADKTVLTAALRRAGEMVAPFPKEGNIIVVISDGCVNNIKGTTNEALLSWMKGNYIMSMSIESPKIPLMRTLSSRIQDGATPIDWTSIVKCPSTVFPPLRAGISCQDFMFVVDGSDSICKHQSVIKNYLSTTVKRYRQIDNVIGVTIFGTNIGPMIVPQSDKVDLAEKIEKLSFPLSGTGTTVGVQEARKLLDHQARGRNKALVLITDGPPLNEQNAGSAVQEAEQAGYKVFVIGVGDNLEEQDLLRLSGNERQNYRRINTYLDLYGIDISREVCGGFEPTCSNRCVNGQNRRTSSGCVCVCNTGFTGTDCSIPGPRCTTLSLLCQNGGTPNFRTCICECRQGYSGSRCENVQPGCTAQLLGCQNGGTANLRTCQCDCRSGYSGSRCETRLCPNQCQYGTRNEDCICTCTDGYTGSDCSVRLCPPSTYSPTCANNQMPNYINDQCQCEFCPIGRTGSLCEVCDITCNNGGSVIPQPQNGQCRCRCAQGYTGPRCEIPPRCLLQQLGCQNGASATQNTRTGVCECSCRSGFTGFQCQFCDQTLSCSGRGTASRQPRNGQCVCDCRDSYTGSNCEIPPPGCLLQQLRCQNGASATRNTGTGVCECSCRSGFTGFQCQFCDQTLSCSGRGTASRQPRNGQCVCDCRDSYTGSNCEIPPPTCSVQQLGCENEASASRNTRGQCECICRRGFSGTYCQDRICDSSMCQNGGRLLSTTSTNDCRCQCVGDFTGSRCETRILNCESINPCQYGGSSFRDGNGNCLCTCPTGLTGTQCESCDRSVSCRNGGTARQQPTANGECVCNCVNGYSGSRCEIEPDCSFLNNCNFNGQLERIGNLCRCRCNTGFTGTRCETTSQPDCSFLNNCNFNGQIETIGTSCRCRCKTGFTGTRCETTTQPVCSFLNNCNFNGQIETIGTSCRCRCNTGFTGTRCETNTQPDCSFLNNCNFNGQIEVSGTSCRCRCYTGFTGTRCETTTQPDCSFLNNCNFNGQVERIGSSCRCRCNTGFTGTRCEINTRNPCGGQITCENGGYPISQLGSCVCSCVNGYTGPTCRNPPPNPEPAEECPDYPCENQQKAYRDCNRKCTCICGPGLAGPRCEVIVEAALCVDCEMNNGVGFTGVKDRCDMFVRCIEGPGNGRRAVVHSCGPGSIWDQSTLSCGHPRQVNCPYDKCRKLGRNAGYTHATECQAYWRCSNDRTTAVECCPEGQGWDEDSQRCTPDSNCPITCTKRGSVTTIATCNNNQQSCRDIGFFPVLGQPNKFRFNNRVLSCGINTIYNDTLCVCVYDPNVEPGVQNFQCANALQNSNINLHFNTYQNGEGFKYNGVSLVGEADGVRGADVKAGEFSGGDRVLMYRFANSGFNFKNFVIRARIQPGNLQPGRRYAVITNGDCNKTASVAITMTTNQVFFSFTPRMGMEKEYSVDLSNSNGWVEIELRYLKLNDTSYSFLGSVKGNGGVQTTVSPTFSGPIDMRSCALQVGQGTRFEDFEGYVDWVKIWTDCDPGQLL